MSLVATVKRNLDEAYYYFSHISAAWQYLQAEIRFNFGFKKKQDLRFSVEFEFFILFVTS